MGDKHDEVNDDVRVSEWVTIREAADRLDVHPNTVRKRVKDKVYTAEKVLTESGNTWLIDPNSLINTTLPRGSQRTSSQEVNLKQANSTEIVREVVREVLTPFVEDLGRVREELGAERVRREQAERERDELKQKLEALQEVPQTPPESSAETTTHVSPTAQGSSTPGQAQPSWWRIVFGLPKG